jgi:hypothetical protein
VYFVEPVAADSLKPPGTSLETSSNYAYFRQVVGEFGLQETSALLLSGTRQTVGLGYERLRQLARQADLLINISGMLADPELIAPIPTRVYLDLDPGFIQLWHATQNIDMHFAGHTHFVTVGLAIGQSDCPVPTCGLNWLTTLQPVVLEHWPVTPPSANCDAFTTVGNWRGYGSIEHNGVFYGQKAHSFRQFARVPTRTRQAFRLALAIHRDEKKDLNLLRSNGWGLIDPADVASTPGDYRRFIQGSRAELGIAKSGYVVARCGWFSDRSACYLASGRAVLAQDTGFSRFLPTGSGLLAFESEEDLLAGIEAINGAYDHHARAARRLAEEFFDSDRVLGRLLHELGVA